MPYFEYILLQKRIDFAMGCVLSFRVIEKKRLFFINLALAFNIILIQS
jgi:hypothetical protein